MFFSSHSAHEWQRGFADTDDYRCKLLDYCKLLGQVLKDCAKSGKFMTWRTTTTTGKNACNRKRLLFNELHQKWMQKAKRLNEMRTLYSELSLQLVLQKQQEVRGVQVSVQQTLLSMGSHLSERESLFKKRQDRSTREVANPQPRLFDFLCAFYQNHLLKIRLRGVAFAKKTK